MAIEWAGLGPELLLSLDRTAAEPLRAQLEGALRDAIRSGRLTAGERLPSSRAMAAELGLSRGLVLECYSQLQAEGFLTSRTGSATRVAAGALTPSPAPPAAPTPAPRLAVDFLPGVPDLTSFPRADWARAMRDSCREATPTELGYGDPRGTDVLRQVLAGYLRRVRGAVADAERIVICGGLCPGSQRRPALARGPWRPARGDRRPGRRRLPRDRWPSRDRGGADPDRRARDRRRRARRQRVARGDPHAHAPVPDRHRARPRAPPGAGRVGRRTGRHDHRGRLRRRVSLRPRPGRRAPGTGSGPGRADRHGQQVARAGAPARLGGVSSGRCSTR